jgi:hypothetical protein
MGGIRPGLRLSSQASSSFCSRNPATSAYVLASGRGIPAGGIVLVRSFLITFSKISGCAAGLDGSTTSRARFAVSIWLLWQTTQYCLKTAATSTSAWGAAAAGSAVTPWIWASRTGMEAGCDGPSRTAEPHATRATPAVAATRGRA